MHQALCTNFGDFLIVKHTKKEQFCLKKQYYFALGGSLGVWFGSCQQIYQWSVFWKGPSSHFLAYCRIGLYALKIWSHQNQSTTSKSNY